MKTSKICLTLAIVTSLVIILGTGACTITEEDIAPALDDFLLGVWEPKVYRLDPNERWREVSSVNKRVEMKISKEAIVITKEDRYNDFKDIMYKLELISTNSDTLRTGRWLTEPWSALQENSALYRLGDSDKEGSIWLQCGDHQLIVQKK